MQLEQDIDQEVTPTHLYRHFDSDGVLLYVGISLSALQRLAQHREASPWFRLISRVEIAEYPSRDEAIAAEREAIRNEKPRHNIQHAAPVPTGVSRVRDAKDRLARQVLFKITYSPPEAALQLGISSIAMNKLIREKTIGCVHFAGKLFITGWQMIDFIESMQKAPA